MTIKSVAIIGAGPSGVIALDALVREQKFDTIKVFERRSEAGGCWIYNDEAPEKLNNIKQLHERAADKPVEIPENLPRYVEKSSKQRFMDTATYAYLESNVDAVTMEYSEEPFPKVASATSIEKYGDDTPFRHNTVIKQWIQEIYKKKGLDDHFTFDTSVELVVKDKNTNKWDITLRKFGKDKDYVWVEHFDAVVVASGHYDVPYVPYVPGLQEFYENPKTEVIHSKAFRSNDAFKDKKTIVVGASISAMDAIQDIIPVASKVISSQKKTSKPHIYFGTVAFEHPVVEKRTQIIKIDNSTRTVYFDDGTSESDVDGIIFATGFSFSFPFLPQVDVSGNRIHGIFQHVFNIEDPSLAYVGAIAAGLTFKLYEWQAVAIARVFAGRAKLPPVEEQKEWERKRVMEKGNNASFITIFPNFKEYFDYLRSLSLTDGPGRQLPPYEQDWYDFYFKGHDRRMGYWRDNNAKYISNS